VTDWVDWHADYDDPGSSLTRRLAVVRRRIEQTLTETRVDRVLSLCAGDGRDILPVLAAQPRDRLPDTVLVESDPRLARAAVAAATDAALVSAVRVVVGDAGDPTVFRAALPVDLLLLCGIFGNIAEPDIHRTIEAAPSMLAPGGTVIWTRGGSVPDRRNSVRAWFGAAGFTEIGFDGPPEHFGVGVARWGDGPRTDLPETLFSFQT
jgi:hypothetical protein